MSVASHFILLTVIYFDAFIESDHDRQNESIMFYNYISLITTTFNKLKKTSLEWDLKHTQNMYRLE